MNASVLPAWRVAWLLTRLRLRRMLNLAGALGAGKNKRKGTRRKKPTSLLLTAAVVLAMAASFGNLARDAVVHLGRLVAHRPLGVGQAFSPALAHVLSVEVALIMFAGTLMTLASRELTRADWDLEWLVTLPAETGALLWSRIAERTVANSFGLLALWPTCTVLAWEAGFRYSALAVALVATLPLLSLTAMAQTLVDTGLRLRLAPSRLRNLQALISIAGILVFYLVISPGMPFGGQFLLRIAQHVPDWIRWSPPGLMLQAINASSLADALSRSAMLAAEVLLLLVAGMQVLRTFLAHGVAAAGARESGRAASASSKRRLTAVGHSALLSPVQRRELTLLARDRNFMVQTLVLPVVIIGMQWMLNGRVDSVAQIWSDARAVAVGVFGVAAYALMLSAFQTLAAEGGALWLLYTFPHPIEAILRDKARLWSVLALAYPVIGFALLLGFGSQADVGTLGLMAMTVLGVPIYSVIAVALGVFGCDPQANEPQQRVKLTYSYLYMLLAGLYGYAFFAAHWWQSLIFIVLSVLLAQALWQKARDQLPYLLDPVASPPPRISTADGLIAAMLFFVLQMITSLVLYWQDGPPSGSEIALSFSVAGVLTYAGVRYSQWRAKVSNVPALLGSRWPHALRAGAIFGIVAAASGIAYLQVLDELGLLEHGSQHARPGNVFSLGGWMLPLGVLAAPLFEEFIFRGLIFGGLRRSMDLLPAAVASAAVFAIVHPPMSMIPVFVLGLCAALAYERSRLLIAPMVVHAIYNAAVIGWQSLPFASA
ncbi:MAG TPA: type II CAAX endopeptidase family protein [Gemmatimonadales bacterium]|nr:type II CAAX endopeptidase family protein [Gemmatimonadales bacterium]